jgi:hypothetical protein
MREWPDKPGSNTKKEDEMDKTITLNDALALAAAEMPAVPKTATNPHFKSQYAPLDAVVAAAAPVLAKHGLSLVLSGACIREDVVTISFALSGHGETRIIPIEMKPRSMAPQDIGGCITYARRYAYAAVGVVTEDDDDGNSVSIPPKTAQPAAKSETAPKPPSRPQDASAGPKPPPYAAALDDAAKAAISGLGWTRAKCASVWDAKPDIKSFRDAVARAVLAAGDDKIPF